MRWSGEDDWGEFAWLQEEAIHWKRGLFGGPSAKHNGLSMKLRLNDFPEEPAMDIVRGWQTGGPL
jgi:hypothetical protein